MFLMLDRWLVLHGYNLELTWTEICITSTQNTPFAKLV